MLDTEENIWHGTADLDELNEKAAGCLNAHLGIEMTEITPTTLKGRMPVDERTIQPAGVLHGGASVAFAETLASWAAYLAVDRSRFHVVGQEINANHLRPGMQGQFVYGEASPAIIGRRSHVWLINIYNEAGKLVCVSRCTMAVIDVPGQYTTKADRPN
ncbi:PaaI family thioesterase [Glutamicibacter creatinolyticus]|uniref:PaaI family thioesterase n=1 Tax=Glutamicibacter creatinolyticus TaxID=162496 RepID=UPI0037BFCFB7